MDKTIQDLIDFFYANKNLYGKMHGKLDLIMVRHFRSLYCKSCSNEWCDQYDDACVRRCMKWKVYNNDLEV